jgi:hypothetical protein
MVAPPEAAAPKKKLSQLALWGMILSIVGCCVPLLWIVGGIFGIVALVKISKNPQLGGQVLAILALVFVLPALISNTLFAIAIPNFLRFQHRSKASEAHTNLRSIDSGLKMREGAVDSVKPPPVPVLAPTPRFEDIPCGKSVPWPATADPGWSQLGFSPGQVRFSYQVIPSADGQGYVIRATADLDCDGVPGVWELRSGELGVIDPPRGVF